VHGRLRGGARQHLLPRLLVLIHPVQLLLVRRQQLAALALHLQRP
jgi:hypothetical protein